MNPARIFGKCSSPTLLLAMLALVTTMMTTTAFDHTLRIDFPGPYCEAQQTCCDDRQDNCAQPISDTLCYCDQFCDREHAGDCCPDYRSYCKKELDPIISCFHNGVYFNKFNTTKVNCNECRCLDGGKVDCDDELCLTDDNLVHNINSIHALGWTAQKYEEWWGHKYAEGLTLRLGTKEPTYRVKAMTRLSSKGDSLRREFDATIEWPRYVNEIKDQGWCGSSWVLTTTSVASDRFAIQSKGREIIKLSPQNILSCTRKQQGCNGGHLDAAWRYLHKQGVLDENCYPYTGRQEPCHIHRNRRTLSAYGCKASPGIDRNAFYTVGPAYSLNNETDIMNEITHSGPVQATMRVYRDFFAYRGGVYQHSAASRDSPSGFHSVKLVGWGEERDGSKYWIAANTWGTWWGELGYFRIKRGSNECGIEEYVLAAWPNVYNYFKAIN